MEKWLQAHPGQAKQIGVSLILLSTIALIWKDGWGVGGFSSLLLVMTVGGVVVAIAPLQYINMRQVSFFTGLSFLFELVIF